MFNNLLNRGRRYAVRNAAELTFGMALVSFAMTVVTASKATLKISDILDENKELLDDIKDHDDGRWGEDYTHEDAKRDKFIIYSKTSVEVVKAYIPAIGFGIVSIYLFMTSRNIMHRRYMGAVAAYEGLSEMFHAYRERVIREEGELKDRHYMYGTEPVTEEVEEVNEKGKKKKVTKTIGELIDIESLGDGSVVFDERSKEWDPNIQFNKSFLRGLEMMYTDKLYSKGFVFLNEIYSDLGLEPTTAGACLGWLKKDGTERIDFGLYNGSEGSKSFINGRDNFVLLTFNHHGIIIDKI